MSGISTHVLDTGLGRPAADVRVTIERLDGPQEWTVLGAAHTDAIGRVIDALAGNALEAETYRLRFDTGAYFADQERRTFYPYVEVVFTVERPEEHHHVPLLLSPFGYSTYRGS